MMHFIDFIWHFNDVCNMFDSRKAKRSYNDKKFKKKKKYQS